MGDWVLTGRIIGLYGLKGWVKIHSHTQPRTNILTYNPLYMHIQGAWQIVDVEEGRSQGKGIVLKLRGYDDARNAAATLGCDLAVRREQLPPLAPDEYYWADLQGLKVITREGVELGVVERLLETGANDVLVVAGERERLIPFLQGSVVTKVDLEGEYLQVDWDPTF